MSEVAVGMKKNNLHHVVAENVGPTLDFTVVTNPMYDIPPEYPPTQVDVPTQL